MSIGSSCINSAPIVNETERTIFTRTVRVVRLLVRKQVIKVFELLSMQTTFLDDSVTIEHARDYGHTHLFEVKILYIAY